MENPKITRMILGYSFPISGNRHMCQYLCPLYPSVFVCFFLAGHRLFTFIGGQHGLDLKKHLTVAFVAWWFSVESRAEKVSASSTGSWQLDLPWPANEVWRWLAKLDQPTNHATNPCRWFGSPNSGAQGLGQICGVSVSVMNILLNRSKVQQFQLVMFKYCRCL